MVGGGCHCLRIMSVVGALVLAMLNLGVPQQDI
jgi:hypothetical protein